jgi:uncharacterized membrane protein
MTDTHEPSEKTDHFAYYSLGVQAVISLVTLILCFYLIIVPTEPTINTTAFNIIVFVVGVWLGRGVDASLGRIRGR